MTKSIAGPADGLQGSIGQTVAVLNKDGDKIGYTYPKRAKGLIKKGRAVPVSDFVIRLKDCPADTCAEVFTMDTNYIFFNPREWTICRQEGGECERYFADDPIRGGLNEMMAMSNFGNRYVRIGTRLHLEKNNKYHFVFWLNGGENDARTEVCNLLLAFTDDINGDVSQNDWQNRFIYNLNRSYIKPVKMYRGWELYDIPFETGDREYVLLSFEADKAPMAVMHADSVESYDDLKDEPDEFAAERPQRHNIVFSDGWPTDAWYSTDALRRRRREPAVDIPNFLHFQSEGGDFRHINLSSLTQQIVDEICDNHMGEICDVIINEIGDDLMEEVRDMVQNQDSD